MTSATIKREIEVVANRIERLICSFQPGPQIRDECVASLRSIAKRIDDEWVRVEDGLPHKPADCADVAVYVFIGLDEEVEEDYWQLGVNDDEELEWMFSIHGVTHWRYRRPPEPPNA